MTINTDWRCDPLVRLEKRLYPVLIRVLACRAHDAAADRALLAADLADSAAALRDVQARYFDDHDIRLPPRLRDLAATLATDLEHLGAGLAHPCGDGARLMPDRLASHLEEVLDMLRSVFLETVLGRQLEAQRRAAIAAQEISSISRQIYFISINASVEAARAGDAGRGFAVIGEQIRTLSQDAARALDRMKLAVSKGR